MTQASYFEQGKCNYSFFGESGKEKKTAFSGQQEPTSEDGKQRTEDSGWTKKYRILNPDKNGAGKEC